MAGTRDSATPAVTALLHNAMAGTAGLRTCPAPAGSPAEKYASVFSVCTLRKYQKPLWGRRKPVPQPGTDCRLARCCMHLLRHLMLNCTRQPVVFAEHLMRRLQRGLHGRCRRMVGTCPLEQYSTSKTVPGAAPEWITDPPHLLRGGCTWQFVSGLKVGLPPAALEAEAALKLLRDTTCQRLEPYNVPGHTLCQSAPDSSRAQACLQTLV